MNGARYIEGALTNPPFPTIDGNTYDEHAYAAEFLGRTVAENLQHGNVGHASYHARSAWHAALLAESIAPAPSMRRVSRVTFGAVLRLQVEAGQTFTRTTEGVMRDSDLAIIGDMATRDVGGSNERTFYYLNASAIGIPTDRATLRAAHARMLSALPRP